MSALFIILVGLTITLFSDKMLISHRCIHGLMSNLIKKSWTVSTPNVHKVTKVCIEDQTNLLLIHALQYLQGSADMTGMAEPGVPGGPLKFPQIS